MAHHHDHDHDDHAPIEEGRAPTQFDLLEQAIRELLIEKNIFSADDLRRQVDKTDSVSPADGAKVVAKGLGRSRVQGPTPGRSKNRY